MVNLILITKY